MNLNFTYPSKFLLSPWRPSTPPPKSGPAIFLYFPLLPLLFTGSKQARALPHPCATAAIEQSTQTFARSPPWLMLEAAAGSRTETSLIPAHSDSPAQASYYLLPAHPHKTAPAPASLDPCGFHPFFFLPLGIATRV
jgi:hypothetical protein